MKTAELQRIVAGLKCQVVGIDDADNDGHRLTLGTIARAFDDSISTVLCQPSLARKSRRPPDVVLIDPEVGVHVFEVKGFPLGMVDGVEAGGIIRTKYKSGIQAKNPIAQVRAAMFDIVDATRQLFKADLDQRLFHYWVVFSHIRYEDWMKRFGTDAVCPPEFIFREEIEPEQIAKRLGVSDRSGGTEPIRLMPLEQLQCVRRAFGDNSVLYRTPEERPARAASNEHTLGDRFDDAAEIFKALSDEQQKLSAENWESGPRLVRGVAGSGKTIVLANNLARRLERMLTHEDPALFGKPATPPRLLAVCYNRTLAPYLKQKIELAYRQRSGGTPPPVGTVQVKSFNSLMYDLSRAGVWRYQTIENTTEMVRALKYLDEAEDFRNRSPDRMQQVAFDAIYVDEGQDFYEEEYKLLKELCRVRDGKEPNLHIFYDDAQNLYGRGRPNWSKLGLNMRGRSHVMTTCFRNTRPIVETAFNVLYGSCAPAKSALPTREFADITSLERDGHIRSGDGYWRVQFARREGEKPTIQIATSRQAESEQVIGRLRWLIEDQNVRPQDILVLAYSKDRVAELAAKIEAAGIRGIERLHLTTKESKDESLGQKGRLTISTVASAKGYDAYCVLLASAETFKVDVTGRATFYVACTRAIERLEVFASRSTGLAAEFAACVARGKSSTK